MLMSLSQMEFSGVAASVICILGGFYRPWDRSFSEQPDRPDNTNIHVLHIA
jgi:hypothetical protein